MTLSTTLADRMRFGRLRAQEALGRPFEFDVEAWSDDADVRGVDLLGTPAVVRVEAGGGQARWFHGLVCAFASEGPQRRDQFRYRLLLRPWIWLLSHRTDTRMFQNLSVPEILKQVLEPFSGDFEFRLRGEYPAREYCVQYRESDFDFASRLMQQEGIYYHFEHTHDRHTMVLVDAPGAHRPCPLQSSFVFRASVERLLDLEPITEWRASRQLQTGQVVLTDYDFTQPGTSLQASTTSQREGAAPKLEVYDYPGAYPTADEGRRYARLRLEEFDSQVTRVHGAARARSLAVGYRFDLTEHPQAPQNGNYLVVSTEIDARLGDHEAGDAPTSFGCRFEALDSRETFRLRSMTPRPVAKGPDTAVVVGPPDEEIHTDAHGRVKVQFHWDRQGRRDANSSCWIRVSQPWAGKGWGAVAIPRIGQEVLVDFLDGDPDRPLITGRVYNGEQTPPHALPGARMVSGMKSQTYKGSGYNEMSMDDTAGKEKITVHAQYDMATTVEHDQTDVVRNNRSTTVTVDDTLGIDGNRSVHVKGKLTEAVDTGQETTVNAGYKQIVSDGAERTITGGLKETLTGNWDNKVTGDHTEEVTADQKMTIGGRQTETVTGARTISVKATDELVVDGTLDVTAKGATTHTSPTSIKLVVAGSAIEITPSGITLSMGPSTVKIDAAGVAITAPKISLNG